MSSIRDRAYHRDRFLFVGLILVFNTFTALAVTRAFGGEDHSTAPLVIVISVDGLGAQLLSSLPVADVPSFTRLARDGVQAVRAETIQKAQTIPGHASMLSGVDTPKHGMIYNELGPDLKKIDVRTLFDLTKKNGLRSAAIFGKEKLRTMFDTGAVDLVVCPKLWPFGDLWGRRPSVVDQIALEILEKEKPNLLFIHYAIVDSIGHVFQWETGLQRMAVRSVDASLGRLLKYLDAKRDGSAIILTADHGGHGGSHGQTKPDGTLESVESDLVIPWLIYRSSPKPLVLARPESVIKIYDTAATAAALLGLTVPSEWNWDGKNQLTSENAP